MLTAYEVATLMGIAYTEHDDCKGAVWDVFGKVGNSDLWDTNKLTCMWLAIDAFRAMG